MGYEPGDVVSGFDLPNANGSGNLSLDKVLTDVGAIVVFECNHCPYVIGNVERMNKAAEKANSLGIGFVGINSNDPVAYPEDSFENMGIFSKKNKFNLSYLHDETQEVAKKYGAVCTPDFFGYNGNLELQYRGRIRELKNLKPIESGDSELKKAMEIIAKTNNGPKEQFPSMGCSIKWF